VKIVLIGAGSFVFGPSVLLQAIVEQRLDGAQLVMLDVDGEVANLMAGVGNRMARDAGVNIQVIASTNRFDALANADFVINCAARQLYSRFQRDCQITRDIYPEHLITEFGGVQGISYSLRQIALLEEIIADMKKQCPNAWLFNVANPLPRVAQAAHELGIKTVGFCSASQETYAVLWQLFTGEKTHYPWPAPSANWQLTMAGTNHFSWLLQFTEKSTGKDLLPELAAKLRAGASIGQKRSEKLFQQTGCLLFPNDNHTKDFLQPDGTVTDSTMAGHGDASERQARLTLLKDIAEGKSPVDPLLTHRSWEHPLALVAALTRNKPAAFHSLNLINHGQLPQLPRNVFVETPATADARGIVPQTLTLPAPVLPYVQNAAAVSDTIVQAALKRSKRLLRDAIERDPTILDKKRGLAALEACLTAHADVLPTYS